jgi:hypothetical protein
MRIDHNMSKRTIKGLFLAITSAAISFGLLAGCTNQPPPSAQQQNPPTLELFSGKPAQSESGLKELNYVSAEMVVKDIYKSMLGPGRQDYIALEAGTSDFAWLTGFSVEVMQADGKTPAGQQYLCHSNLEIADVKQHYMKVANRAFNPGRYFTISQGQEEAKLPEGFGIPINTGHALNWNGQVLNLNEKPESPIVTKQRVKLKYLKGKEAENIQPLFAMSLVGLKTIGDTPADYSMTHLPTPDDLGGGGCLVGTSAVVDGVFTDKLGNQFTAHWVVKPGKEENKTRLDDIFTLPYDTTLHYAMLHVHPFCDSVELYDLTDQKTVLAFDCAQLPDKIGLLKTQDYSDPKGTPLYKDHKYELRSVYNNTSGVDQDAMVVLYVYLKDQEFKKEAVVKQKS